MFFMSAFISCSILSVASLGILLRQKWRGILVVICIDQPRQDFETISFYSLCESYDMISTILASFVKTEDFLAFQIVYAGNGIDKNFPVTDSCIWQ